MINLKNIIEEWKLIGGFKNNTLKPKQFCGVKEIESMNSLLQALEEAVEIIYDKDSEDRKAYGNYYESKDLLAKDWLQKWGFE